MGEVIKEPILITGHRGFIGQRLFTALGHHHDVVGVDKVTEQDILQPLIEFPPACTVYHLAAQTSVINSVIDPLRDALDNIIATVRIMLAYPNAKIIYTASGGASEQDEIAAPYGLSKAAGGKYLNLFHNNSVICNLPNIFGEGGKGVVEKFIADAELAIYGNGHQMRNFVYIDDIVRGLIQAAQWPAGVYSMGADHEVTVLSLALATKKPFRLEDVREGELFRSVLHNTTPDWRPIVDVLDYLASKIDKKMV